MRALLLSSAVLLAVVGVVGCSKSTEHAEHAEHAEHGAAHGDAHGEATKDAVASAAAAPAKVDRETVDADGIVRRGTLTAAAPLTVTEATQKAADLDGKSVKISGTVESVCQPMGCWFVMKGDAGETIRVSSKGHNVFMPKSSAGRVAVAEGDLTVRTLSKEQAQHFEDEKELKAGETRKVFDADVKELSLALVGVELRPAS
jgi:hypothetical protein